MKKKTAFLALALFAGSTGLAMADPFLYANVKVAPGVRVAFGSGPVVENVRRAPLPAVEAVRCEPAKVVARPAFDRRVAWAGRTDRFHRRIVDRYHRDYDRGRCF